MSYTFSGKIVKRAIWRWSMASRVGDPKEGFVIDVADLAASAASAREAVARDADPATSQAVAEQIRVAEWVAMGLARRTGRDDETLIVNVVGHANPDHAPRDGHPDEFLRVELSVARDPEASLKRGIEQAAAGEVTSLGSFAAFVDDDESDSVSAAEAVEAIRVVSTPEDS